MTVYDFDLGIIGGGAAGLTIASGSAQLGAKTLLVEKEKELGGDCLHFGCVPSKTLIKTARVYHMMKQTAHYGLPELELPSVDFKQVKKRINRVIQTIQQHDSEERFCSLGVKVEFGVPHFIDEHAIRLHGKTWSARSWVVATGSSPSIPPLKGLSDTSYLTNQEIFSLERLPSSMIILGAGPIAMEMAQAFCRLGTEITVIQRSGQILSKEDKDMADDLMKILHLEGVYFHLNTSVLQVGDNGTLKEVRIQDENKQEKTLKAEEILVALGRSPNLSNMGIENTGIKFNRKGIETDNRLRTSQKHMYAAGDVTGAYQFTHAAGYEGGIVISNAIFRIPRQKTE